ncbi:MAG: hypothetical protein HY703_03295 [Gemmatimonadetes bacterium]|nr:hypothetical protein [Gemmatimonadota bacterium]
MAACEPLHGRGLVVLDERGQPVRMVGTGQDITERKQAEDREAQLLREQSARAQAEAANRGKAEFLAVLKAGRII